MEKLQPKIYAALRATVWNEYIGDIKTSACFCCKYEQISCFNFECGHIISVKHNGVTDLQNLRPVCSHCNKSMNTLNMYDFVIKNGFDKNFNLSDLERLKTDSEINSKIANNVVDNDTNVTKKKQIQQSPIINNNNSSTNSTLNTTLTDNFIIKNSKTINVLSFVNLHFTNVNPLALLNQTQITQMITTELQKHKNRSFCELLLCNYDQKTLDKFLGNMIINKYKKQNPAEQQFWVSNIRKLTTFVIRQKFDNMIIWMNDECGAAITNNVIYPLLNELKLILIDHITKLQFVFLHDPIMSDNDMEKNSKQTLISKKIINEINDILCKQILRYISPQFQFDSNLLEKL